ncbi:MAG: hypothetical protein ACR2G6_13630 [Gemmatimonadaceae bacterium]
MRALCIARHRFLSDHYCEVFAASDIVCSSVVGFEEATRVARDIHPDVVLCDYDLLVTAPLERWERDSSLMTIPILAISLTKRPDEVEPGEASAIAGFLYLPTLSQADASRLVRCAARRPVHAPSGALKWRLGSTEVQRHP